MNYELARKLNVYGFRCSALVALFAGAALVAVYFHLSSIAWLLAAIEWMFAFATFSFLFAARTARQFKPGFMA